MAEELKQTDIDEIWRKDGERNGWRLPAAAPLAFRVKGVRLVRAAYLESKLRREAKRQKSVGIGLGIPDQRDLWVIYGIARGWC
jgi:hypothetical protein